MLSFLTTIEEIDERNKLEKLYMLYHKEMLYTAYNILKDYHEAEDAVQECIIKLSSKLDRISQVDCNRTRAFLVTIVRNISLDTYRRRKKQKNVQINDLEKDLLQDEVDFDFNLIMIEQVEEMVKRLTKLDNSYADILALRYFYEYSNSEIAELINLSEGHVRIKIHRAQKALKKILLEEGSVSNVV